MLSVRKKFSFKKLLHIVFKALCGNVFHTNHHDAIHLLVYLFRLGMGPARMVIQSAPLQLISAVIGSPKSP